LMSRATMGRRRGRAVRYNNAGGYLHLLLAAMQEFAHGSAFVSACSRPVPAAAVQANPMLGVAPPWPAKVSLSGPSPFDDRGNGRSRRDPVVPLAPQSVDDQRGGFPTGISRCESGNARVRPKHVYEFTAFGYRGLR
jgi:hypothetical protein